MGHQYKREDEDGQEDEEDLEDAPSAISHRRPRRRSSPLMQLLAAIGFIAIGAVVVPALWGLVAEAPNLRRYMRIMRM